MSRRQQCLVNVANVTFLVFISIANTRKAYFYISTLKMGERALFLARKMKSIFMKLEKVAFGRRIKLVGEMLLASFYMCMCI